MVNSTTSHVCESSSGPTERAAERVPDRGGVVGGVGGGDQGGGGEGGGGDGASKAKDCTATSETPPTETPRAAESATTSVEVRYVAPASASAMVGRITSAATTMEAAEMASSMSLGVTP